MNKRPAACPRCESAGPEVLCHSPVKDAWTVFHCATCFFTWRSSEPDFITDPAKYPAHFKIAPADMAHFSIMPAIPERKRR
ncbi:TPA: phenolic acid decarboxylase subunit D [Serratia rubidaea]|nr:phenolic acid decarboxylase subunit D [Serratia rubidaea]HDJ1449589.1 phenolic acid decarboxylase subunit D [Serratia rubidaea]HDJ1459868.1 phenolic acid decarboxylase subunit D [Serratia rubidaea]HDJ2772995.1 phenolic acid decarboxylase subunit D [Serratia rubidaea]